MSGGAEREPRHRLTRFFRNLVLPGLTVHSKEMSS